MIAKNPISRMKLTKQFFLFYHAEYKLTFIYGPVLINKITRVTNTTIMYIYLYKTALYSYANITFIPNSTHTITSELTAMSCVLCHYIS